MESSSRKTDNREKGDEMEMRPLNSLAQREAANRASESDEQGGDSARDEGSGDVKKGEADTESAEKVSVTGDGVRC